jgi:photosystem II stability/assembly factor-like uncharacterized protein
MFSQRIRTSVGSLCTVALLLVSIGVADSSPRRPADGLGSYDLTSIKGIKRLYRDIENRNRKARSKNEKDRKPDSKEEGKGGGHSEEEDNPGLDYLGSLLYMTERRAYPGDKINAAAYEKAMRDRASRRAGTEVGSNSRWQFLGPKNLDIPYRIYYGVPPLSGRVNAIAVDPSNSNIWWLGAAGGGIWKTTDGGTTWNPLGDAWDTLLVSSIAIDPTNPSTVYVGTGDFHGYGAYAVGIMKTTNGGQTWSNLGRSDFGIRAVSSIVIDPDNTQIIHAATGRGSQGSGWIWRSTNGGNTWTRAFNTTSNWAKLDYSAPNAGSRWLYAAGSGNGGTIFRSSDRGATWSQLTGPSPNSLGSIDLGTSQLQTNTLYVLANSDRKIYKSIDAGATWTDTTNNFPTGNQNYNWSQSWYNYHLTVSRNGSNDVVYVGQIDLIQSTNGGGSWRSVGGPTYSGSAITHNDQHSMAVDPQNPNVMIVGNDGGVYRMVFNPANDSWTITPRNAALGITQFYEMAIHPTNPAWVIGGTQDNASPVSRNNLNQWDNVGGGDGAGCAINPSNPNIQYASSQYQNIYRTANAWQSSSGITPSFSNENEPFIGNMAVDPNSPHDMYIGTNYLWRWRESTQSWTPKLGNQALSGGTVDAIAIAPGQSSRIYTGASDGQVWMTQNGGTSWTRIDSGSPGLPNRSISAIHVSPTDPNNILVTVSGTGSGHLYQCTNTTATTRVWVNRSGTGSTALPDVPANCVVRDPESPSTTWYVGTDIGVYQTNDSGANWTDITVPNGLPTVIVNELRADSVNGYLVAATYGRGIWRISTLGISVNQVTLNPTSVLGGQTSTGTVRLNRTTTTPVVVSLFSNNPAAVTPSTVTIQNSDRANFTITTTGVTSSETARITAEFDNSRSSADLTILPPTLTGFTFTPSTSGPGTIVGRVTISSAAPTGGMTIDLASANTSALTLPTTVQIPAGQTSVNFNATVGQVSTQTDVITTASGGSGNLNATVTVVPLQLMSLTLTPNATDGGNLVVGRINLNGVAPSGGWLISLRSSDTLAATVPTSVTVPAGQQFVNFTVTTLQVGSNRTATISAQRSQTVRSASLTVRGIPLVNFTIVPNSTPGGVAVAGTVTLSRPAPTSGIRVTLTSTNSNLGRVPPFVTVYRGQTTARFSINSMPVLSDQAVTITARNGNSVLSRGLKVLRATVTAISFTPNPLVGGAVGRGTVTMSGPAPAGGLRVNLRSGNTAIVRVPGYVTIPAGQRSGSFAIGSSLPRLNTVVTITATYGASTKSGNLTVRRP